MKTIIILFVIAVQSNWVSGQSQPIGDRIAEEFIAKAEFRNAIEEMKNVLGRTKRTDDQKYLMTRIGYCYYELNHMFEGTKSDDDSTLFYLDKVLKMDPMYIYAMYVRARFYINKRKYSDAVTDLTLALAIKPNDLWLYMHRSDAYRGLRKKATCKTRPYRSQENCNQSEKRPDTDRIN